MDTQTQIDRLIELAIVQRSELKALVEQLPQLREYLGTEIEKTFEQVEPQLRTELEEFCNQKAEQFVEALRGDVSSSVAEVLKTLENAASAKYSALMAERQRNIDLEKQAEAKIAEAAAAIPSKVKEIVTSELARFPRAGEIDKLRKEFAEPRGLNPRGKWTSGETYNKLDLVSYNGDSFVSSVDGNTEKPSRTSESWTLSAARGGYGGGGGITSLIDLYNKPDNGEVLIGNGTDFVKNTLTAGTGITITNGAGTITIDATGAQETLTATVTNAESVPITRGQVVYIFGATGNRPSVKLASNASEATSSKTFGVVSDASIAANGIGTVTCVGVVDQLSLGSYSEGATVYLGSTAGTFTATKPYAPNHLVYVGIVQRANNGNGQIYVKIQNGYELDEIHDVQINAPKQAGQTLIYDATNSLWKNARLTAGVGVSITNADSSITISADGGVNYQGTWNASTNSPALTSSVGTKGFYYVVSVAGSTNLNGITDWQVGDWAIFNGSAWQKVDTTDQVTSVFGRQGAVTAVSTDYSSVGITNTAIGASNPSTGAFTTLSSTGTAQLNNLKVENTDGDAYASGPSTAGKYLTLRSGNTTGGINFRDSNYNQVGIYNQTTDTWSFAKSTTIGGNLTVSGGTALVEATGAQPLLHIRANSDTYNAVIRQEGYNRNWYTGAVDDGSDASWQVSTSSTFATVGLKLTAATNALQVGGNLTVSGTGTSSMAGNLLLGAGTAVTSGARNYLTIGGTLYGSIALKDNADAAAAYFQATTTGAELFTGASKVLALGSNNAEQARFATSGNLLLGTTTDNGYKLQVNGSTWTNGSARLANDLFVYGGLASPSGYITSNSGAGGLYFANQGTSTAMRFYTTDSGATSQLALTLDSSQRTILSGPLRLKRFRSWCSTTNLQ